MQVFRLENGPRKAEVSRRIVKIESSWSQVDPRTDKVGARDAQGAPIGAQEGAKASQLGPKLVKEAPKTPRIVTRWRSIDQTSDEDGPIYGSSWPNKTSRDGSECERCEQQKY